MTERKVQAAIVRRLRRNGHVVMVVGTAARPMGGWTRITPGCPDLFVLPKDKKNGYWIAIEVKSQRGKLRSSQKTLHELGAIKVARSPAEALAFLETL